MLGLNGRNARILVRKLQAAVMQLTQAYAALQQQLQAVAAAANAGAGMHYRFLAVCMRCFS